MSPLVQTNQTHPWLISVHGPLAISTSPGREQAMAEVVDGTEGPIDSFLFKQTPAGFKLRTSAAGVTLKWPDTAAPKASLLCISHAKGLILFPHAEKGALGFAPINKLTEKDYLATEQLAFPGDESLILAMCLDPTERFLFLAKGSHKLYAIDLASDSPRKRPFLAKIAPLDAAVVSCVASTEGGLLALFENGRLRSFSISEDTMLRDKLSLDHVKLPIGCMSQIRNGTVALGAKSEATLLLMSLASREMQSVSLPATLPNCGVSSIHLLRDAESVLFSLVPDAGGDVDLFLMQEPANPRLSRFMDPCCARPPRGNQFYFVTLPGNERWTDNLDDFVVMGNYGSPDIGICGRLERDGVFQTFYIDNDEGLAQLPLQQGQLTYPLGLALDLTSTAELPNPIDSDAPFLPPAPVLWILTTAGQLCPFAMLKTDHAVPWPFMRPTPDAQFSPPRVVSASDDGASTSEKLPSSKSATSPSSEITGTTLSSEEEDTVSSTAGSAASDTNTSIKPLTPLLSPTTPSKVPLAQLASLQKSSDSMTGKEQSPLVREDAAASESSVEGPVNATKPPSLFSFKPVAETATNSVTTSPPAIFKAAPVSSRMMVSEGPLPSLPVKKDEPTESIDKGPYKNILLAELSTAHGAMQDDLFELRQLAHKNALLLRHNAAKYYQSLEALETYAASLERLLTSGERVFGDVEARVAGIRGSMTDLTTRSEQARLTWQRVRSETRVDWGTKTASLQQQMERVLTRVDQVIECLTVLKRDPAMIARFQATFEQTVQLTLEQLQVLMAKVSVLFSCEWTEETSDELSSSLQRLRSLNLSADSLLDQLHSLSIKGTGAHASPSTDAHYGQALLRAAKMRGARMLIPSARPAVASSQAASSKYAAAAASGLDEAFLESFVQAVRLTENVPSFNEARLDPALLKSESATRGLASSTAPNAAINPTSKAAVNLDPLKQFQEAPVSKASLFTLQPRTDSAVKKIEESSPSLALETPAASFSFTAPAKETTPATALSFAAPAKEMAPLRSGLDDFRKASASTVELPSLSSSTKAPTPLDEMHMTIATPNLGTVSTETSEPSLSSLTLDAESAGSVATSKSIPGVFGTTGKLTSQPTNPELLATSAKPFTEPTAPPFAPSTGKSLTFGFQMSPPASTATQESNAPQPSLPSMPALFSASATESKAMPPFGGSFSAFSSQQPPVFGTTSLPTGASSTPAFGQTNRPASALGPTFSATTSGFSAFAQNGPTLGFASFVQPGDSTGSASSLDNPSQSADKRTTDQKPSSSFSFSGFRG